MFEVWHTQILHLDASFSVNLFYDSPVKNNDLLFVDFFLRFGGNLGDMFGEVFGTCLVGFQIDLERCLDMFAESYPRK